MQFSLTKRIIFFIFGLFIGTGCITGSWLLINSQNLFGIISGLSVFVGGCIFAYWFFYTALVGQEPLFIDE